MPSVLYTAVNEYAEESDPLAARAVGWPVHHAASGAAVRAMPKGTFLQRGNHQCITYGHVPGLAPPRRGVAGTRTPSWDPRSPPCQETALNWEGLGRGMPFMQSELPSRNQNAANMESSWRRLSDGQALRTSNWCQRKSSSAPRGKQRVHNHLQLTQICCENARQKLQRVMSTGNKGDAHTSFCMFRQGRNSWQAMSSCRYTFMILGAKSVIRSCYNKGLD